MLSHLCSPVANHSTTPERQILHVDMDAFFAAVEQQDRPELRGKPVLVGGTGGRGVVSTASYEARAFGPRSAMPLATALRLCPQAIVLPVRMARYREVSACLFRLLEQFTPLVEPVSVDEAFLDWGPRTVPAGTGSEALFGPAPVIAARVQQEIQAATGLTASVGVAPNKFLAKLASDLQKPGGLVVISRENLHEILDPLPVDRLWGVGAATVRQFEAWGMRTVGHVRRMPLRVLAGHFGAAEALADPPAGAWRGRPPVCPDGQAKSISHEVTFAQDVTDRDHLRRVVLHPSEDRGRTFRSPTACAATGSATGR